MNKIIALTVIAAFITLSANAQQVPPATNTKVVPTHVSTNVKKMKDTDDQLLSKQQNNNDRSVIAA